MVMEYWSGWFDLWGGLHHVFTAEGETDFVLEVTAESQTLTARWVDRVSFQGETVSVLTVRQASR